MNRFVHYRRWSWSILAVSAMAFAMGGCSGDDGKDGAQGPPGEKGDPGDPAPGPDALQSRIDAAQIESCGTCHSGVGEGHQAVYDPYTTSVLAVDITNVGVQAAGGGFDVTVDFSVTLEGAPYIDPVGTQLSLDNAAFYFVEYDAALGEFVNQKGGFSFALSASNVASNGDGTYTLAENVPVDPSTFASGALVARIADGVIEIEERAGRVTMYDNNASDYWEFGDLSAFESPANVEGCQACHGVPYYKHGNLPGMVADTTDFTICKACHNDSTSGTHPEWQFMVDNPLAWATGTAYTAEEEELYAYTRKLSNDVHMSHALEFPYPQSMANCKTCHGQQYNDDGVAIPGTDKLSMVLDNSNFKLETCKSCHVIRGIDSWPGEDYNQPHRPPAFSYLWQRDSDLTFHLDLEPVNPDTVCTDACHGVIAPSFSDYHNGYDPMIYDEDGNRYADTYTASIENITYDDAADTLTVEYSASDPEVVPELLVSFYGWNTKDFIVPSHWRDASTNCGDNDTGCRFEYEPGDVNVLFTADETVAAPSYKTTANLSAFVAEMTDDIPTLIDNMDVTKIEVTLTPYIDLGLEDDVTLDAVTATYDLMAGGPIDNFYKGTGAIVDYEKCNACHDQLAVTFHSGSGRAGEIAVCRNCHASLNGGSHLEMQSRSIESYVHAIHSFQDFDLQGGRNPGIFDDFDAVEAKRYDMHIEHVFPYFTRFACKGCHNEGTYNVPDQSKSMPGLLSDSWMLNTWYTMEKAANGDAAVEYPAGRNIGTVPEYVVGPASKACGGCHRATPINEDNPGELAAFNAHTAAFGTLVENSVDDETAPDDAVLFGIVDKIMTLFE